MASSSSFDDEESVRGMFGSSGGLLGLGVFYERLILLVVLVMLVAIVWDFVNDVKKRENLKGKRKVRGGGGGSCRQSCVIDMGYRCETSTTHEVDMPRSKHTHTHYVCLSFLARLRDIPGVQYSKKRFPVACLYARGIRTTQHDASLYIYICIYMYIYVCVCVCVLDTR